MKSNVLAIAHLAMKDRTMNLKYGSYPVLSKTHLF